MNNENYRLLEVSENATDEEIRASYERLKAKYNEEKWQDGEAGNNAARMLGRLDTAYAEIMKSAGKAPAIRAARPPSRKFPPPSKAATLRARRPSSTTSTSAAQSGTICNPSSFIKRTG